MAAGSARYENREACSLCNRPAGSEPSLPPRIALLQPPERHQHRPGRELTRPRLLGQVSQISAGALDHGASLHDRCKRHARLLFAHCFDRLGPSARADAQRRHGRPRRRSRNPASSRSRGGRTGRSPDKPGEPCSREMAFGESASPPARPPRFGPGFLESPVQIHFLLLVLNSDGGSRIGTHWGANLLFSLILPSTYPHRAAKRADHTQGPRGVRLRPTVVAFPRAAETGSAKSLQGPGRFSSIAVAMVLAMSRRCRLTSSRRR